MLLDVMPSKRPAAASERVVSCTVTQKEGVGTDTFDLNLIDGNPFLAIPQKGTSVRIAMGYNAPGSLGDFIVDKIGLKCLPYSMKISGKSADLRSGKLKQRQERHWDKTKLKDIIGEIVGESGLTPAVDDAIGGFKYEWVAQNNESNIHFLKRLEERHNGLFHIKDNMLLFTERGGGKTASGGFMGSFIITPDMIVPNTCACDVNDRPTHGKVSAHVQDRDKAEKQNVEATADDRSSSVFHLPDPFTTKEEAEKAAESRAKQLKRESSTGSVEIVGNASPTSGIPLLFSGVRPGVDGVPFVIDTVTHTYSKTGGYRTKISFKLFDGKSGGAANDNNATSPDAANYNESVTAKNSAEGTSATPKQWFDTRRYPRLDGNLFDSFVFDVSCKHQSFIPWYQ